MSRSRSPEKRYGDDAMRASHDRPEVEEQPAKRVRVDTQKEDRARGKRLFGNLLGTLQKFKTEDKTSRTSVAAKRREEISEKIQKKIKTESTLHHEIAESERELKALRIQTDSAEFVLRHKEAAMIARHASLEPISHFLHTSAQAPGALMFDGGLLDVSPIPLNNGPRMEKPTGEILRPLYFLPKILLEHQQNTLKKNISTISELITDEAEKLSTEKSSTTATVKQNRARIEELVSRLTELRSQEKSNTNNKKGRDDFGRTPREEMDVDVERDRGTSKGPAREETMAEADERDMEDGVQIRGEDGDIEVEY